MDATEIRAIVIADITRILDDANVPDTNAAIAERIVDEACGLLCVQAAVEVNNEHLKLGVDVATTLQNAVTAMSAHYTIHEDGTVEQHVPTSRPDGNQ